MEHQPAGLSAVDENRLQGAGVLQGESRGARPCVAAAERVSLFHWKDGWESESGSVKTREGLHPGFRHFAGRTLPCPTLRFSNNDKRLSLDSPDGTLPLSSGSSREDSGSVLSMLP